MPRSKSPTLTDAELRLMRVLWSRGEATVSDVTGALTADDRVAYSTVQTTLGILEDKGYVTHRKEGRAFVYRPLVDSGEASTSALRYILDRFFDNSPEALLLNVVQDGDLDVANAEAIRALLENAKNEDEEDPTS